MFASNNFFPFFQLVNIGSGVGVLAVYGPNQYKRITGTRWVSSLESYFSRTYIHNTRYLWTVNKSVKKMVLISRVKMFCDERVAYLGFVWMVGAQPRLETLSMTPYKMRWHRVISFKCALLRITFDLKNPVAHYAVFYTSKIACSSYKCSWKPECGL